MTYARTESRNGTHSRNGKGYATRDLPRLVQSRRLVLAVAIVVAVVFAPVLVDSLLNSSSTAALASADATVLTGERSLFEQNGRTPDEVLDEVEGLLGETSSPAPTWFTEQVGLPSDASEMRVSSDGTVVGFVLDGSPDSAVEDMDSRMCACGWTSADLGGIDGRTYVKAGDQSEWIVMTATQVGSSTSVVMRYVGP